MKSELERLKQNRQELREIVIAILADPRTRMLTPKQIVDFARMCIAEIDVHSLEM